MKSLFVVALSLAVCVGASAQTARQLIEENPARIGNQLHRYETLNTADTPAPSGYKPFYVSHFGRHGSRYLSSASKYYTSSILDSLSAKGLLTAEGEQLKADMDSIAKYHAGMDGILTQVGSKEHQGVASRLYERCPQIFSQKDRNEVLAVSSTVVRCIQSMTNFCTALKGKSPSLEFSFYTNYATDERLTRAKGGRRLYPGKDNKGEVLDSMVHANMQVDRMCKAFFSNPSEAVSLLPNTDAKQFFYDLIAAGVIEQCLDEDAPKIYGHFTTDELYAFWLSQNASTMASHGFCYENGGRKMRSGQMVLKDMLSKADEALQSGSRKAADLRFSHDSQTLPLVFTLKLGINDHVYHMANATEEGWYGFQHICMCSNVQMIFYRNKKGEVLVKFLHNEQEKTISGFEPYYGPYYRWTELRPYLYTLTEPSFD